MRKYQLAWEAIKANGKAQLAADTELHDRIINGVRKEKARDLAYKLVTSEAGTKHKLMERIEGKVIAFYLVDISL